MSCEPLLIALMVADYRFFALPPPGCGCRMFEALVASFLVVLMVALCQLLSFLVVVFASHSLSSVCVCFHDGAGGLTIDAGLRSLFIFPLLSLTL